MTVQKFTVGQPVVITRSHTNRVVPARVVSVGRAVVRTDDPGERYGYRIDNGTLNEKDFSGHGHLYTLDEWELRNREHDVRRRLQAAGITVTHDARGISVDTLEKVADLIEADTKAAQ